MEGVGLCELIGCSVMVRKERNGTAKVQSSHSQPCCLLVPPRGQRWRCDHFAFAVATMLLAATVDTRYHYSRVARAAFIAGLRLRLRMPAESTCAYDGPGAQAHARVWEGHGKKRGGGHGERKK